MENLRPWAGHYAKGVPANIDDSGLTTVVDYITGLCGKYKSKKAFSSMGKEITYKQLDTMSSHFGAYLHSRGLEPGDKIAIMLPNLLQYPIALIGALKAGLIVVNTNPLYTPREMEHQFNDSEVKSIVILENFAHNLEKILPKTAIKTIIVTSIGEMLGMKGSMVNFAVRNLKRMVPKYNLPNVVDFKSTLKQGANFEIQPFPNDIDSVIVHQYTGGTTGVSKGAMLTNRNLLSNMKQLKSGVDPFLLDVKDPIILAPLPLYHIFAFTVNCLTCMDLGALAVLVLNPKDLKTVVKEYQRYEIHGMTGVNTLFIALLNFQPFKTANWKSLKFVSAGGTALQKAVGAEWKELTGCDIYEGYGMTEASPAVAFNPYGKPKPGTVGIPVPSTDVRIVSESGEIMPIGQPGEIQVKGPQVMKGYYNQPEATARTIVDGEWLCTGDIGQFDDEGYLSIVDRKKDMILVSGFNVYPNEIEDVLAMHPKILEGAAIGIASDKSGECVKVFIVKGDKSLTKDEVKQHCRENLTGYKVPKEIEFRKDLPKSNVGKILRRVLKDEEKK